MTWVKTLQISILILFYALVAYIGIGISPYTSYPTLSFYAMIILFFAEVVMTIKMGTS